jgi:serine/threonine-protein kinase HipA
VVSKSRQSKSRALRVWLNGIAVAKWDLPARGEQSLTYDQAWLSSPDCRPLSLSLPAQIGGAPHKGEAVANYFDNLLPDNDAIRRRIQSKFNTPGTDSFSLLEAIGRDCVGAVQLLPLNSTAPDITKVEAESLSENDIAAVLRGAVTPTKLVMGHNSLRDDFRISIAGAQEKTALLWHNDRWCVPLGSTPTTHIFKLPMGLVGNMNADLSTSVENEWLCGQILHAYGLPVANSELAQFEDQKVLIVERFDRVWAPDKAHWYRRVQEDFCQVLGVSPWDKYEADGGPGIKEICHVLAKSETWQLDLENFFCAQILFWMLAATDGHAKNFSIFLLRNNRYQMTPLYDVLSAWPIIGNKANHLPEQNAKLAMAFRGKNKHYHLRKILRRHMNETAASCGVGANAEPFIEQILAKTPGVIDTVQSKLPADFPLSMADSIFNGLQKSAKLLADMPAWPISRSDRS